MSLFISYSSVDITAVGALERNLESFGKNVWRDDEILGGEVWWAAILEQIRECEVFIFALSPNSLESDPCQYEYDYARALGVPVLPVEIGDVPTAERRNHAIYREQLIDYRNPTAETAIQLVRAISELEGTRPPLPEPLPEAPPIPYEYLLRLGAVIRAKEPIPYGEQRDLIRQFREALDREKNPSVRESAFSLLRALGDRPETSRSVTAEIEELIAKAGLAESASATSATPPPKPPSGDRIEPTPTEPPVRREPNPPAKAAPAVAAKASSAKTPSPQPQAGDGPRQAPSSSGPSPSAATPVVPHPTTPPPSGSGRRAASGWYADPRGPAGQMRYWDGTHWTEHTHAGARSVPPGAPTGRPAPASQHAPKQTPTPTPAPAPSPAPTPPKSGGNLWSTLGIVFGAIAIIPVIGWVTWFLGIAFAIVAAARRERLWVVALVVAIVGSILGFIILLVFAYSEP
ncbi:TIR domain-containing protein [Microbacterium thalassium]|uniref:TIR domain-containing protein n=1 Tax=Microbacterium thalassium TaxID=362649 RepID=A0A7X0KVN3_9MICO|nr:TIR domain-containing protein [Microbacterium thalassium]MBB6392254.1 hypothetical protein [Microbacterium thalassium]